MTSRKKSLNILVSSAISVFFVLILFNFVDSREIINILRHDLTPKSFLYFLSLAAFIVLIYGYRWWLLLDHKLGRRAASVSSLLCIGGNMFLPARGGDILKVHHSHMISGIPHSQILSRLIVEKIVDLLAITIIGMTGIIFLESEHLNQHLKVTFLFISALLSVTIASLIALKFFTNLLLRKLQPLFRVIGKEDFFKRHISHLFIDIRDNLSTRLVSAPIIITTIMWLTISPASYIVISDLVGVSLSYQESLLVLFAGALGLMLPAAPSGIGTFHASIVSAFVLIERPPSEGLLVGTAIHLLFFLAYAVPALIFYFRWRLTRKPPE